MGKVDYSNKRKIPKEITGLLNKYSDIIAKDSNDLRRTLLIKHKINLIHPFPIVV